MNLRDQTFFNRPEGAEQKTLPWPGVLSTVTRPPWAWAMCLTMASPRPVPPILRLRPASTR